MATPMPTVVAKEPKPTYHASIFPGSHHPLPHDFGRAVLRLEKSMDLRFCLVVQQGTSNEMDSLDESLLDPFAALLKSSPKGSRVGLLIHSPGGFARPAYQMARLLQRQCGGFVSVVPRYAKSAATILAIGAEKLYLHRDAELGPLDAQIWDVDREARSSALDEFQALERLHAQALTLMDSTMALLVQRSRKRTDILLPMVLNYTAQTMRPMFEKIDTVHYTSMARTLKVAEAYALRLLRNSYPEEAAVEIARQLVYGYPEHGFVIDSEEASGLGLQMEKFSDEQTEAVEVMIPFLANMTALGLVNESAENNAC